MLVFNPSRRINAEDALGHPYLAYEHIITHAPHPPLPKMVAHSPSNRQLHDPNDEPVCTKKFYWDRVCCFVAE